MKLFIGDTMFIYAFSVYALHLGKVPKQPVCCMDIFIEQCDVSLG